MKNSRLLISTSYYFILFFILNYVIFYGLSFTFNVPRNELYYILLFIVAFSHPISLLLLSFSSNYLVRALYAFSAVWLGMSAYILILFAVYLLMGYFIKIPAQTAGILIVGISLVITIFAVLNVFRLEIKKINISLDNFPNNLRAVQISDVHIGPIRKEGYIKKLVDKIIEINPEIVFITGDLFDGSSKLDDEILKDFSQITVPILFIMGNHDFYQDLDEVINFLKPANIEILYNQVFQYHGIQVVGVPFSWKRGHLENSLKTVEYDKDHPNILLYHLPREFEVAENAGIDLQLSGHTHAGQFFPFNFFVKLIFPHLRGLYTHQGAYLYVSQGTGTLGPPMRLGSTCEITLISINCKNQ